MQESSWIPIGCGERRADLEDIIAQLKQRWQARYAYRIEEGTKGRQAQPFRLYLRHL